MLGIRVDKEYDRLQAFYDEALIAAAWPEARLLGIAPEVSGWSPGQHLYHVSVINETILTWMLSQVERKEAPSTEGRPNGWGWLILATARIPRGRARAARRFTPPDTLSTTDVREVLNRSHAFLQRLQTHLPDLPQQPGRLPHPVLGRLNAPQYLRFARIHSMHHLFILRDIDQQQAVVPVSSP